MAKNKRSERKLTRACLRYQQYVDARVATKLSDELLFIRAAQNARPRIDQRTAVNDCGNFLLGVGSDDINFKRYPYLGDEINRILGLPLRGTKGGHRKRRDHALRRRPHPTQHAGREEHAR